MMAASKVPMLKPKNGNAPLITQVVEGVETIIASTTAEEKAQKSTNNTNGAVNTAHGATTANTQATAVNSTAIDNLSDAVICAFFASQPNSPQLDNEDLQQIYPDELKEIDLRGYFARECRALRSQDTTHNKSTKRIVPVETPASAALVSCDGLGDYDWSDQAEEGPTNFSLMAYSSTSSNFELVDKCKTGLGYNAVPPPYTGNFMPPKPNLSGLEEFVNEPIVTKPTVKKPVVETSEAKASVDKPKIVRKNFGSPFIEDWISDSEDETESKSKIEKETVKPSFAKIKFVKSKERVKSLRKTTVKQAKNQKFNFSKYIFESMVKNLDNLNKNLMYPRETPLFPTLMVQAQEEMGEGSTNPTDPHHTPTIIQPSTSQPQNTKQHMKPRRKVTEVPQPSNLTEHAVDEADNEEMDNSLERAATTATSLDAEQDKGVNTPQSGKDSQKLNELMELLRVESFKDEGLGEKDASKQGRIADIDANEDIYLVNVHNDEDMFGVNDLDGNEVIVESVDVAEQAKEVVDDITLAKALVEIKSAKPKADKVVIQEPEQGITTITPTTIIAASLRPKAKVLVIHEQKQAPTSTISSQQPLHIKDKGKGKVVEPEPVKKMSKKDQSMLDEELAFKLQVEEEEERLTKEKTQ
uniref:Uncharacterized protein n=1 Tax=Tanacetum cinerariifolium TaxID=118510 RepID=A0A6L2LXM1_TANCI|nr:hypothetical protein [Tanacetum cinerariifolium]